MCWLPYIFIIIMELNVFLLLGGFFLEKQKKERP